MVKQKSLELVNEVDDLPRLPDVWNPLNYWQRPKNRAVFSQPSETTPDMSMSVRKIMTNYAGGTMPYGKTGVFEDPEYPSLGIDFRSLDLVDIQEIAMKSADMRQTAEKEITKRKAEMQRLAELNARQRMRDEVAKEFADKEAAKGK